MCVCVKRNNSLLCKWFWFCTWIIVISLRNKQQEQVSLWALSWCFYANILRMKGKDKGRIILRNVCWAQLTSSLFSYSCLVIIEVFMLWKPKYICLRLFCTKVSAANMMTEGFQQSSVHKVYYRACWKESPDYDRYSSTAGENKSLFSTKAWFRSEVCTYFSHWSHVRVMWMLCF